MAIKQYIATVDPYAAQVDADSTLTLARNVKRLMAERGDTQTSVAKRGKISQRAVGYLVTYGATHSTAPTLRTVDGVARAFDVPAWMLFIPDLPIELLRGQDLEHLVGSYQAASPAGRSTINRIAESEVRYAAVAPAAQSLVKAAR